MKQYHVLGRLWIGFGVGTIIGNIITLIVSYAIGTGTLAYMPQLKEWFLSDVDAFFVQFLACGLLGVLFAEAGILLVLEKWNYPIRCLIHFAVTSVFYIPFLLLMYFRQEWWILLVGVLANVLFTYVVAWLSSYLLLRSDVDSINRRIEEMRREEKYGSNTH